MKRTPKASSGTPGKDRGYRGAAMQRRTVNRLWLQKRYEVMSDMERKLGLIEQALKSLHGDATQLLAMGVSCLRRLAEDEAKVFIRVDSEGD